MDPHRNGFVNTAQIKLLQTFFCMCVGGHGAEVDFLATDRNIGGSVPTFSAHVLEVFLCKTLNPTFSRWLLAGCQCSAAEARTISV